MAGQISESDQIKQFKEFLGTYNKITENCFLDCIKDFTSREVKPEELSVKVLVPQLLMGGIFVDMEVAHLQPPSHSLKLQRGHVWQYRSHLLTVEAREKLAYGKFSP
ncbi:mitochondrial import inner membrane translocase subunit Tim9 isoform X1 [Apus apus]|uniref:mitochondrial import inner membrane translocase subunit Tim9 isoform X1 n=1 Tax=Apus apus TaxID=8895 RepID=UPI0021F891F6|nr:mitochondrial import inner membrane translocase subunit Tim9 isoform X1 [Apus apus]XP_051478643.1 mitochondrial import inner membrane translocase subunit Tim9 isoform X1 [Apus apus]